MTVASFFASTRLAHCPVCGDEEDNGGWGAADGVQHVRSYRCGAAFERSADFIAVRDICPGPSRVASAHLRDEAGKAGA